MTDFLTRNQPFIKKGIKSFYTKLNDRDERAFLSWVRKNGIEVTPDYDMRGFYKGLMSGDERASSGISPADGRLHFSDAWKTPLHQSFSNESIYANDKAPHWDGYRLVGPDGTVYFDETPQSFRGDDR